MRLNEEVFVVGAGLAGLTAGALLAKEGYRVHVVEQNYQPGGCTTSYWRKGFVFESGATTIVGMDSGMPLHFVLKKLGLKLPFRKLETPMRIHLPKGISFNRPQSISAWKEIVGNAFNLDKKKSDAFWHEAYNLSQKIWEVSTRHRWFPPEKLSDVFRALINIRPSDLLIPSHAFTSVTDRLKKYGLDKHKAFIEFIDAQLMITAQNTANNTNFLFGSAALCYTNYSNFYLDGGLINLVKPLEEYILEHGGEITYREKIHKITRKGSGYQIETKKHTYQADYVISGIPSNNFDEIYPTKKVKLKESGELWSAFQMGIGYKNPNPQEAIHQQVLLDEQLPGIGGKSYFISMNHPDDTTRTDATGQGVISISSHIKDPGNMKVDTEKASDFILNDLIKKQIISSTSDIVYLHTSGPKSWEKWTGRMWGFVGGYPQEMRIKPWQMKGARWDGHKAYICGDSVYPGQGIPGVSLSGIIAWQKLISDWG